MAGMNQTPTKYQKISIPDNFWPTYNPERSDLTSKWHFSAGENQGGGKEEVLAPAYVVMYVLSVPRPPHCLPGFNDSLLRYSEGSLPDAAAARPAAEEVAAAAARRPMRVMLHNSELH